MFSLIPWRKRTGKVERAYDPFSEMEAAINRFFGDTFTKPFGSWDVPALNMYHEGDNLVVEASTPGYNKNDITVELDDDLLTIRGEKKKESKEEEKDYYYREFSSSSFTRTIALPTKVKPEDLKASYTNGVLKVKLPAPRTEKKSTKIKIE